MQNDGDLQVNGNKVAVCAIKAFLTFKLVEMQTLKQRQQRGHYLAMAATIMDHGLLGLCAQTDHTGLDAAHLQ